MDKSKGDLMADILHKMRDLRNHQEVLIDKTVAIQIDLIEASDYLLKKSIIKIHTNASENYDLIDRTINRLEMKLNSIS